MPRRWPAGRHVEYESRGWQYAFILEFELAGVLKPVVHAFGEGGAPRHVARAVVLRCAELLLQVSKAPPCWREVRMMLEGSPHVLWRADDGNCSAMTSALLQVDADMWLLLQWRASTDAGWLAAGGDPADLTPEYTAMDDALRYRVSRDAVGFHLTLHRCDTA